jgi:signal transduction histidine kinase
LSIVRRIVELHGARLELTDSESGQGLLVRVIWPNPQPDATDPLL